MGTVSTFVMGITTMGETGRLEARFPRKDSSWARKSCDTAGLKSRVIELWAPGVELKKATVDRCRDSPQG